MKLLISCPILWWCLLNAKSLHIVSREQYSWCQEWDIVMSTRSAMNLEEQMVNISMGISVSDCEAVW